jgi:hypothetical protein
MKPPFPGSVHLFFPQPWIGPPVDEERGTVFTGVVCEIRCSFLIAFPFRFCCSSLILLFYFFFHTVASSHNQVLRWKDAIESYCKSLYGKQRLNHTA